MFEAIKNIFTKKQDALIGKWEMIDPTLKNEKVYMIFSNKGELIYEIYQENQIQKIVLTYEVKGNVIITDQPSHPQVETTEFVLLDSSTLQLKKEFEISMYKKVGRSAF